MPSDPPSSHALVIPTSSTPARFGTWLALRLITLTLGLPTCAALFLGAPVVLAACGVVLLHWAGVRFEPWSEVVQWQDPGRWIQPAAIALVLFVIRSSPDSSARTPGRGLWLVLGLLVGAPWALALAYECLAGHRLPPALHYTLLAALCIWLSWTLAWLSGTGLGRLHAKARELALGSAVVRGAIMAGGPTLAFGVGGTAAVFVASDLDRQSIDALADDATDAFAEAKSLQPAPRDRPRTAREREVTLSLSPEECLERIYRGRAGQRLWDRAVRAARARGASDPENVASEAAMQVCAKRREYRDFDAYVVAAARRITGRWQQRDHRLGRCELAWSRPATPLDDEECIGELLCRLDEPNQSIVRLFLEGHTDGEIAMQLSLPATTTTKRRQRAIASLSVSAQHECR
jgi:DNA-directed RNA polymerase specialized sigma24 family protein